MTRDDAILVERVEKRIETFENEMRAAVRARHRRNLLIGGATLALAVVALFVTLAVLV